MKQDVLELADMVGAYPLCGNCRSRKVVRDAWAEWNFPTGEWVLKTVFDDFCCDACKETHEPDWELDAGFRKQRIQRLNDALRRGEVAYGSVVLTPGVQELAGEDLPTISTRVSEFNTFDRDNDPHAEHDFGAFECCGQKLFFKIDYFDRSLKYHSPDEANPELTHRVLTIMLASEY